MADNTELVARLRKEIKRYYEITHEDDPGISVFTAEDAADALEAANARIAELETQVKDLTEFVESVRHIETMKALMRAKVKKLKAMNRRGK